MVEASSSSSALAPESEVLEEERESFEAELVDARGRESAKATPERYVDGKLVVWAPQPGSQVEFLSCPLFEALYHGTRGSGKTDALLMAFAQYVGRGFGSAWRGVIFRETYPQLADVVAKSERWFRQIFPNARFVMSGSAGRGMAWHFETGETLLFRHMRDPRDYWNYHGHEYPFIGWEELTNWPNSECYTSMFACCRSSSPDVPRMIRSTTNPYGVGYNWVRQRFRLDGAWWRTIVVDDSRDMVGDLEPPRAAIHGHVDENRILLEAEPGYKQRIVSAATNQAMAEAWSRGSWLIVAGGMFSDVWSHRHNAVPRFEVPWSWRIDRAFDWGSSAPFSVGWYAQSDGSDLELLDGRVVSTVRGDLFRIKEWYGSTGRANEGLRMLASEVARGIVEREVSWGWRNGSRSRVSAGPADSAIFRVENGNCIATDMAEPVRVEGRAYAGVRWTPSDKGPGSRKNGWELMRKRIRAAQADGSGFPRESAGLFVVDEECPHWIRTVLSLPRDPRDMDDVDTKAEDHAGDETRYRVRADGAVARQGRARGWN